MENFGFKFDHHQIDTEDGYILTLFRIQNEEKIKEQEESAPPPVVFL